MAQDSTILAPQPPPGHDMKQPLTEKNENWRYEYRRATPKELKEAFDRLESDRGLAIPTFARIFGLRLPLIDSWLGGKKDIPVWVPVAIAMLYGSPAAIAEARRAVAELIVRDRWEPELGEYPFRRPPRDDEEDSP